MSSHALAEVAAALLPARTVTPRAVLRTEQPEERWFGRSLALFVDNEPAFDRSSERVFRRSLLLDEVSEMIAESYGPSLTTNLFVGRWLRRCRDEMSRHDPRVVELELERDGLARQARTLALRLLGARQRYAASFGLGLASYFSFSVHAFAHPVPPVFTDELPSGHLDFEMWLAEQVAATARGQGALAYLTAFESLRRRDDERQAGLEAAGIAFATVDTDDVNTGRAGAGVQHEMDAGLGMRPGDCEVIASPREARAGPVDDEDEDDLSSSTPSVRPGEALAIRPRHRARSRLAEVGHA